MISALKTYLPRVHIFGSPELVREYLKNSKPFEAPAKYLVSKDGIGWLKMIIRRLLYFLHPMMYCQAFLHWQIMIGVTLAVLLHQWVQVVPQLYIIYWKKLIWKSQDVFLECLMFQLAAGKSSL
jgi:hypothetical protein